MTIWEVLQNAHYNLNNNGHLGYTIGIEQFNAAMEFLANGADLFDEFDVMEETE